MSKNPNLLDAHILPEFEFTLRDEVITKLLDFVECPMLKVSSENIIIFNKQCYDRDSWVKWIAFQDDVNIKSRIADIIHLGWETYFRYSF